MSNRPRPVFKPTLHKVKSLKRTQSLVAPARDSSFCELPSVLDIEKDMLRLEQVAEQSNRALKSRLHVQLQALGHQVRLPIY